MTGWVAVSERLPDNGEAVLVSDGDLVYYSVFDHYAGSIWYDDSNYPLLYVTHWMPLPLGPNGERRQA